MAMVMATASPWTALPTSVANHAPSSRNSPPQPSCATPFHKCGVLPQRRMHCRPLNSHRALSSSVNGRRATGVARATIEDQEQEQAEKQATAVSIKDFLEDLKAVGRIRLIVNTGVAVLESTVNSLDKLFYQVAARGEYANLMMKEENVDFHLLIDQVASAKLETKMRGDTPIHLIRLMDISGALAASLLVLWKPGSDGDFDDGQEEAYQNLLEKYGSDITFAASPSR